MKLKTTIWLIFFTIVCSVSSSCQTVKYGHPGTKVEKEIVGKIYDKNGVRFSYPKDWQIVEDGISENNVIHIAITDAPFCFVRFKIFSSEIPVDLRKEAESTDKKLQSKNPTEKTFDERVSSVDRNIQGQNHEVIRFKSSFINSDATIPDTTDFLVIEGKRLKALIIINSDDADWKVADKEFQFILDSLKIE